MVLTTFFITIPYDTVRKGCGKHINAQFEWEHPTELSQCDSGAWNIQLRPFVGAA